MSGDDEQTVGDVVSPAGHRPRRIVESAVLVILPLLVFAGLYLYGPQRQQPEPESPTALARDPGGDEVLRLREVRREIEASPEDVDGALRKLQEFALASKDEELARRAVAWREAIAKAGADREYEVRLLRYRLSQAAYERALNPLFEPGEPDVYLRVWRRRDGDDELVSDGKDHVLEGWTGDWSTADADDAGVVFRLAWKIGEAVRVELLEQDLLGDNVIAEYATDGGLGILLLSTPRISGNGHVVELESDFAFGR